MNEAQQIGKKIRLLEEELYTIQEKCKHLMVEKVPKPDTGHYDICGDWYECFCPECLKRWNQ